MPVVSHIVEISHMSAYVIRFRCYSRPAGIARVCAFVGIIETSAHFCYFVLKPFISINLLYMVIFSYSATEKIVVLLNCLFRFTVTRLFCDCHFSPLNIKLSFPEFKGIFANFDKDNSGQIDVRELREVMQALGQDLTDEEVMKMISSKDLDGTIFNF